MIRNCIICNSPFKTKPSHVKIGKGKLCSDKCRGIFQRTKVPRTCKCGKVFMARPSDIKKGCAKFCSTKCFYESMNQTIRNPWKRGDGYMVRRAKLYHREIIESILKRKLESTEVVHHVNNNRSDNRIKNLMLFSSNSSHKRFHKDPSNVKPHEILFDGRCYS